MHRPTGTRSVVLTSRALAINQALYKQINYNPEPISRRSAST